MQRYLTSLFLVLSFSVGCISQPNPTPEVEPTTAAAQAPETRTLTICLGNEPETLFPLAASSRSAWSVLEAIYDGPVDVLDGRTTPVILEALSTRQNGGITLTPVEVKTGDLVADSRGNLTSLAAGIRVFPSGCSSPECVISWDGITPLTLDQMSARFTLKPNLVWSDGKPLSMDDSLYSFEVASDPAMPMDKHTLQQTSSYQVIDALNLQWQGLPGLVVADISGYFRMPLPRHAWGGIPIQDLLSSPLSSRAPLGWGAYVLAEWKLGESIRMIKNPLYFRAGEGLPKFDQLVFRFTGPTGDATMNNLEFDRVLFDRWNTLDVTHQPGFEDQACDLADSTSDWDDQIDFIKILLTYANQPAVQVFTGSGEAFSALLLNPEPLQDASFNPFSNQDFRQVFTSCLDRKTALSKTFYTFTSIPSTYLPHGQDAGTGIILGGSYDAQAAALRLESLGWIDSDHKTQTPRVAKGIPGVTENTPLIITIHVPDELLDVKYISALIASSAECGITIRANVMRKSQFYDAGVEGSPFGNQWQAAIFNFGSIEALPCIWLNQAQASSLGLIKLNNETVTHICHLNGFESTLSERELTAAHAQLINALNLSNVFIPLYYQPQLVIARKDMCSLDVSTSRSDLNSLEEFNYGEECP